MELKRALDTALSHICAPGSPLARSGSDLVGDQALLHVTVVGPGAPSGHV
jgi:hypothetical protein